MELKDVIQKYEDKLKQMLKNVAYHSAESDYVGDISWRKMHECKSGATLLQEVLGDLNALNPSSHE